MLNRLKLQLFNFTQSRYIEALRFLARASQIEVSPFYTWCGLLIQNTLFELHSLRRRRAEVEVGSKRS